MKIVLFLVDGLDDLFISRNDLKSLLQEVDGCFYVDSEYCYQGQPLSPRIWGTVITGVKPSDHKCLYWWSFGKLDLLRKALSFIKGKRRILERLGFKPKLSRVRHTTIFDIVRPSKAVLIPTYNDDPALHRMLEESFYRGIDDYIKTIWKVHRIREEKMWRALEDEWNLFAVYFDLVDLLSHVCWTKRRVEVIKAYLEICRIVNKVKEKLGDERYLFLIISDHGFEKSPDGIGGIHSRWAFWSMNLDIGIRIYDFTHIYPVVLLYRE